MSRASRRVAAAPDRRGGILALGEHAAAASRESEISLEQKSKKKRRPMMPVPEMFNPKHYEGVRKPLLEAETMPAYGPTRRRIAAARSITSGKRRGISSARLIKSQTRAISSRSIHRDTHHHPTRSGQQSSGLRQHLPAPRLRAAGRARQLQADRVPLSQLEL